MCRRGPWSRATRRGELMEAVIVSHALDTNGQNARYARASEKWGTAPGVLKALAIGHYDPAGVIGRYAALAEKTGFLRIRSVHRATHIYQQMPADIIWTWRNYREIRQLAWEADIIHLNNSTMAYRRLHVRHGTPTLLHHHGSLFRRDPREADAGGRRPEGHPVRVDGGPDAAQSRHPALDADRVRHRRAAGVRRGPPWGTERYAAGGAVPHRPGPRLPVQEHRRSSRPPWMGCRRRAWTSSCWWYGTSPGWRPWPSRPPPTSTSTRSSWAMAAMRWRRGAWASRS